MGPLKADNLFKRTFNQMCDLVAGGKIGDTLASETQLSTNLGVSRTTIRKVLEELVELKVLRFQNRVRTIQSTHVGTLYFPAIETISTSDQVEKQFLEWMLRDDAQPGTLINELELARQFSVGTTGIREFLNRFSRFGLIEKRRNSGWVFQGFSQQFATELFEIREMFELRSAVAFCRLPQFSPLTDQLRLIGNEHRRLLQDIDERYHDFSDLDDRFHRLVISCDNNRFINDFYDVISFVFHYHYQWNKVNEQERNCQAIHEHLDYIDALLTGDEKRTERACKVHLTSARSTLMESIQTH